MKVACRVGDLEDDLDVRIEALGPEAIEVEGRFEVEAIDAGRVRREQIFAATIAVGRGLGDGRPLLGLEMCERNRNLCRRAAERGVENVGRDADRLRSSQPALESQGSDALLLGAGHRMLGFGVVP